MLMSYLTLSTICTENLLKAREKDAKKIDLEEMVSSHTDALALLGHSQYELSLKRRPALSINGFRSIDCNQYNQ